MQVGKEKLLWMFEKMVQIRYYEETMTLPDSPMMNKTGKGQGAPSTGQGSSGSSGAGGGGGKGAGGGPGGR
jgi:TPP-dependent pyruvate/acetoin dehydrogenase alpha subunit